MIGPLFKDKEDRTWDLSLNAPVIKDVQSTFNVKLTSFEEDPLDRLSKDPITLVDVIYIICKKQADALGLSSRDFGECLMADLTPVTEALRAAILNFFPSGVRSQISTALKANTDLVEEAQMQLMTRMTNEEKRKILATRLADQGEKEIEANLAKAFFDTPSTTG